MTDSTTTPASPPPGRPLLGHGTAGLTARRPAAWSDVLRDVEPEPRAAPAPDPAPKHCWYDGPHGRQSALLLEWSRTPDGRHLARVAVPVPNAAGGWVMVEQWVDQSVLAPAYSPSPSS